MGLWRAELSSGRKGPGLSVLQGLGRRLNAVHPAFDMTARELIDAADDELLCAIEEGYLHSLRKTMVRLETSRAFEQIKTCTPFWTVVTQVDADTDEEERLLEQVRLA